MLLWSVLPGILWKTSLELVICESNLFEMLVFYWFLLLDECNLLVDKQHAKVVIPFSMYTEHQCCWHSWQYRADCMPGGNKCSSMQSPPGWICLSTVTHIHHGFCLLFPNHTEIVVVWRETWSLYWQAKFRLQKSSKRNCMSIMIHAFSQLTSTSDLIELFKMARGLSAIPLTDFFKVSTRPFGSTTRGHSWKLIKVHSNTDTRLYFFSSRVLNRWNSLLQEAVSSSTVNIFKGHPERTRSVKMGFFVDHWSA